MRNDFDIVFVACQDNNSSSLIYCAPSDGRSRLDAHCNSIVQSILICVNKRPTNGHFYNVYMVAVQHRSDLYRLCLKRSAGDRQRNATTTCRCSGAHHFAFVAVCRCSNVKHLPYKSTIFIFSHRVQVFVFVETFFYGRNRAISALEQ